MKGIILSKDIRRAEALREIISAAIPIVVFAAERGLCERRTRLCDLIRNEAPFDLIIQHCGATNGEYSGFLTQYLELCAQENWPIPTILLYSGDYGAICDAKNSRFVTEQDACALFLPNIQYFEQALPRFLPAWRARREAHQASPWDILLRFVPQREDIHREIRSKAQLASNTFRLLALWLPMQAPADTSRKEQISQLARALDDYLQTLIDYCTENGLLPALQAARELHDAVTEPGRLSAERLPALQQRLEVVLRAFTM